MSRCFCNLVKILTLDFINCAQHFLFDLAIFRGDDASWKCWNFHLVDNMDFLITSQTYSWSLLDICSTRVTTYMQAMGFVPFSTKSIVALSTAATRTWALLDLPFLLLEGLLLLDIWPEEETSVVTWRTRGSKVFSTVLEERLWCGH